MVAELVVSGIGKPVNHTGHHDLESFFYVLLEIAMLYNGPYRPKSEDQLMECFNIYFNTCEPSLLKMVMIHWSANICKHISPYFSPLIPLLNTLHWKIISLMAIVNSILNSGDDLITHKDMVEFLLDALSKLPDSSWVTRDHLVTTMSS
ncbi:hypothetical protein V8B97DRAFT_1862933 [Scleroderma yunnanense]